MASGQTHIDEILDVFKNNAYAARDSVYVSLHTGDPASTGANEKALTGAYGRQKVLATSFGAITGTAGTDRRIEYGVTIEFATATADWNTISHLGVYDAVTGGNFLLGGSLTASQNVANGVKAQFLPNAFDIQHD